MIYLKALLPVLYLVSIHLALMFGYLPVAVLLLVLMAGLVLWHAFDHWLMRAMVMLLLLTVLLTAWFSGDYRQQAAFATPVIINLTMGVAFLATLLPGRIALVTRFASLVRKDMPPRVVRYTWNVTLAWTLLFFGLALESWWFARYSPFETWSFMTNIVNYFLLGGFFVVEFLLRRVFLRGEEITSLKDYLQALSKIDLRHVMQEDNGR